MMEKIFRSIVVKQIIMSKLVERLLKVRKNIDSAEGARNPLDASLPEGNHIEAMLKNFLKTRKS